MGYSTLILAILACSADLIQAVPFLREACPDAPALTEGTTNDKIDRATEADNPGLPTQVKNLDVEVEPVADTAEVKVNTVAVSNQLAKTLLTTGSQPADPAGPRIPDTIPRFR